MYIRQRELCLHYNFIESTAAHTSTYKRRPSSSSFLLHFHPPFFIHRNFAEYSPKKEKQKKVAVDRDLCCAYVHTFFLQMNPSALLRLSCRTWNSQCRHQMSCMECIYSLQTHKSISLLFYTTLIFLFFETGNLFRFMCVYIKFILIHILN